MSTEEDDNKKFIGMADSFIDVANEHCDKTEKSLVNASFLYGSARFCAFVTASTAESKEKYEANIDDAVGYYAEEYKKMLQAHMEQYKSAFKEAPRYEHLIQKK